MTRFSTAHWPWGHEGHRRNCSQSLTTKVVAFSKGIYLYLRWYLDRVLCARTASMLGTVMLIAVISHFWPGGGKAN